MSDEELIVDYVLAVNIGGTKYELDVVDAYHSLVGIDEQAETKGNSENQKQHFYLEGIVDWFKDKQGGEISLTVAQVLHEKIMEAYTEFKKKTETYADIVRFYGIRPASKLELRVLKAHIPRLKACEELDHRFQQGKLTPERVHNLYLRATGDRDLAEKREAWFRLEEMHSDRQRNGS